MESGIEWIAEFERHLLERGFARTTIASYVADVRLFYRHLKKKPTKVDFTRFNFLDYKRQLVEARAAISTVNKRVNSLQAFNLFLIERGCRQDQSVSMKRDRIKVASGSERQVDVFTDDEMGGYWLTSMIPRSVAFEIG